MTVASWLAGITPLMMELAMNPEGVNRLLETVTTSIIRWLHAQLATLHAPEGIMVLDDVVGMVSKAHYEAWIHPHLSRIFNEFEGLIRVYHNDTPCPHLMGSLAGAGFDVFNFSHTTDIAEAKAQMGHRVALMGNVPPLDLGVRGTPEEVTAWARECLRKGARRRDDPVVWRRRHPRYETGKHRRAGCRRAGVGGRPDQNIRAGV
jgi:uroporphyrinogen decarboxylase